MCLRNRIRNKIAAVFRNGDRLGAYMRGTFSNTSDSLCGFAVHGHLFTQNLQKAIKKFHAVTGRLLILGHLNIGMSSEQSNRNGAPIASIKPEAHIRAVRACSPDDKYQTIILMARNPRLHGLGRSRVQQFTGMPIEMVFDSPRNFLRPLDELGGPRPRPSDSRGETEGVNLCDISCSSGSSWHHMTCRCRKSENFGFCASKVAKSVLKSFRQLSCALLSASPAL